MIFRLSSLLAMLLLALPITGLAQTVALPTDELIQTDLLPSGSLFDGTEGGGAIEPLSASDALMTLEDADQIAEVTEDLLPMSKRPLTVRLGVGIISDDNIYQTHDDPVKDITLQYVGGITYELHKNETTRLALDYDVTGYHLLDNSENDSWDQIGKLSAGYNFSRTKFEFVGAYSHLTGAERQLGAFVDRDVLAAKATMIYELGAKTNLRGDLNFNSTDYRNLQAFQDMSVRAGIDYKVGAKTSLGVAGVYGVMETTVAQALANTESTTQQQAALAPLVAQQTAATQAALEAINVTLADLDKKYADDVNAVKAEPNPADTAAAIQAEKLKLLNEKYTTDREALVKQYNEANVVTIRRNKATNASAARKAQRTAASRASTSRQFYKQLLLTASYEATGKLFFNLDFGMDFREYEGEASTGSRSNFTYRLAANYKMRERTLLSLSGSRQVDGSAATLGVSVRRNVFQLGVDQQIGDRFRLAVATGYDMGQFESSRTDIASNRTDNYYFGKATLTYNFTKSAYVSAFYEYRNQSSSEEKLTYTNNRYGLQLGVTF
jgi:hypothetical protein